MRLPGVYNNWLMISDTDLSHQLDTLHQTHLLSRRLRPCLVFFEAKVRREQVKALQFFDMADHGSLVNTELAGYGGVRRRAWSGCLIEVAFDRYIDRKP